MSKIEVCAANMQSVTAARLGGAHRIELCTALPVGGVTPGPALIRWAVAQGVPVCVLIRPREGNFVFEQAEIDLMAEDIAFCKAAGAAGVVVGALTEAGTLDLPALQQWADAAQGMELVFHRAFDFVADTHTALEQLIGLGFHRVLSSGQAATAWAGRDVLRAAVEQANGRIQVMPGSGVHSGNIADLAAATGANTFHLSAKEWVAQGDGTTDIPGLEMGYFASSVAEIQRCVAAF